MTRLAAPDLAAVAAFARDLDERAGDDLGSPAVLDAMLELVRADALEWGISDERQRQLIELRHYPPLVILRGSDPPLAAANAPFWASRPACPICGPSRLRKPGAFKLSDLKDASLAHPQHAQCAGIDVVHQLNLFMRPRDILARHVVFSRAPGVDFSERDRQVLELAGVFIVQETRTLDARRNARAALAAFEAGGGDQRRGLLVIDPRQRPALISAVAQRLLDTYFGWRPGARLLPAPVERWLAEGDVLERIGGQPRSSLAPLRRVTPAGELMLRSVALDGQLLIVLDERPNGVDDARALLTAREREVLDAVAEGLTNSQIAERLWVSPATVGKHLENAFAKLDVRSRAAAVARISRSAGWPWGDESPRS